MLVRVFPSESHRPVAAYSSRGDEPVDEIMIHTWRDCALSELASLLVEARPSLRKQRSLSVTVVDPERASVTCRRGGGGVVLPSCGVFFFANTAQAHREAERTLEEMGFRPGFYLDVAVA